MINAALWFDDAKHSYNRKKERILRGRHIKVQGHVPSVILCGGLTLEGCSRVNLNGPYFNKALYKCLWGIIYEAEY